MENVLKIFLTGFALGVFITAQTIAIAYILWKHLGNRKVRFAKPLPRFVLTLKEELVWGALPLVIVGLLFFAAYFNVSKLDSPTHTKLNAAVVKTALAEK